LHHESWHAPSGNPFARQPKTAPNTYGRIVEKNSFDDLPQLSSILVGDMSFVGLHPALFNQHDLFTLRTENGVDKLLPGMTGQAQVNGRKELPIP